MKDLKQNWQNGSMEQFISSGAPSFVIGISLNNSYFSSENIEKIISWCDQHEWAVTNAIMIPDEPTLHTMLAMGRYEPPARQLVTKKANAIENKCRKVKTKNKFSIFRWSNVKDTIPYKICLDLMQSIFKHDTRFKKDCLNVTKEVLLNKKINPTEEQLSRGVQFLLEELAFIYGSKSIIGAGSTCYVYHNKFNVLYNLLSGQYNIPKTDEVFSLVLNTE